MNDSRNRIFPLWMRFLYAHNPLYLVSACLVLHGLRMITSSAGGITGGWLMTSLLCGYALLLAGAAILIIRTGRVWEDARTILLVIVLLFFALSISFDELLLLQPGGGAKLMTIGWLFSVLLSEGLFRILGLSLRAAYRVPYYVILSLLFGYPVLLAELSFTGYERLMDWGVFAFPLISGVSLLILLPVAIRGGEHERAGDAPWRWPIYPWALFFFLATGLCVRSFTNCMAFQAGNGAEHTFAGYFLVPVLASMAVLFFALANASGDRRWTAVATWLPLGLLALSLPGKPDGLLASGFLNDLITTIGSPIQMTLVYLLLFYAVLWCRGRTSGMVGVSICLGCTSLVGPQTVNLATCLAPQALPLGALALVHLWPGMSLGQSGRVLFGGIVGVVAASQFMAQQGIPMMTEHYLLYASLGVTSLVAIAMEDRLAVTLRRGMIVLLPILATASGLVALRHDSIAVLWHSWQTIGWIAIMATAIWYRERTGPSLTSAMLSGGVYFVVTTRQASQCLAGTFAEKGAPWLGWGLLMLGVAMALSLYKGGVWRQFVPWLKRRHLIRPRDA